MTAGLMLDTHVALWLTADHPRLAGTAHRAIEQAWQSEAPIFVSPMTIWEVVILDRKRCLHLNTSVADRVTGLFNLPGIKAAPVTPELPILAYDLPGFNNPDPADRLVIATAIHLGCPLLTYDRTILRFAREHGASRGFSVLC